MGNDLEGKIDREGSGLERNPGLVNPQKQRFDKGEKIAEDLYEQEIFEINDFLLKIEDFKDDYEKLTQLKDTEKEDWAYKLIKQLRTIQFLMGYVREEFSNNVVITDGFEIFTHQDGGQINFTEIEELIGNVEGALRGIGIDEENQESLYERLSKNRDSISPKDFLKLSLENRLRLVSNIESWNDLNNGALVVFDFGSNRNLEYQIGVGDLMPFWIRNISVNGVSYERRGNQGFYNNGKYLAIFNGSRISILDTDESYSAADEYRGIFHQDYGSSRNDVFAVAQDFLVDAYLLEAVLSILKGDEANFVTDDFEFLHIAARYIQNAENRFTGTKIEDGHYTVEFLTYALSRFNLFNTYVRSGDVDIRKVGEKYAKLRGISLEFESEDLRPQYYPSENVGTEPKVERRDDALEITVSGNRVLSHKIDDEALRNFENMNVRESFVQFQEPYTKSKMRLRETVYRCYEYARVIAGEYGLDLKITSAYRDFDDQALKYIAAVKKYGEKRARKIVAPPGESWHHSAGAVDITLVRGRDGVDLCRGGGGKTEKYHKKLEWIMNRAGFVNYSAEWWHFEIGTGGWYEIMSKRGLVKSSVGRMDMVYERVNV